MTPDDLRIVAADAATIDPDPFATRFYELLFDLAPEARAMFPDDLRAQRAKLMSELSTMISMATSMADGDLDRFVQRAHRLGDRHAEIGATAAHYQIVGVALMEALAGSIAGWDDHHDVAWRRLYGLVAATMQEVVTSQ